jgi:hypothetical protein
VTDSVEELARSPLGSLILSEKYNVIVGRDLFTMWPAFTAAASAEDLIYVNTTLDYSGTERGENGSTTLTGLRNTACLQGYLAIKTTKLDFQSPNHVLTMGLEWVNMMPIEGYGIRKCMT